MKKMINRIPNIITVSRIVVTFILLFLIEKSFSHNNGYFMWILGAFAMICFSDLIDGKIARKLDAASKFGAKLDVSADLLYIIISYIALINFNVLPLWFFIFVCLKFLEFVVTSKLIKQYSNSNSVFVFDKIGRIVSAAFLVIPPIACLFNCLGSYGLRILFNCILYIMLAGGIYSSYLRIRKCAAIRLKEVLKINHYDTN